MVEGQWSSVPSNNRLDIEDRFHIGNYEYPFIINNGNLFTSVKVELQKEPVEAYFKKENYRKIWRKI